MCTAVYFERGDFFGRTLDLECSLGERVCTVPRGFSLVYKNIEREDCHAAFIGMAHRACGYPLFFDGVNEYGVAVAALNFPGCARYHKPRTGAVNLAPYEIIQYVLARARTLNDVRELLRSVNVTDEPFSGELPNTPLHFLVSAKDGSLAAEPCEGGFELTENSHGVLSNAPEIRYHLMRTADFRSLAPTLGENRIAPCAELPVYSRGLGAVGLPGDFSSTSRFVRALYAKNHTQISEPAGREERLSAFFHVMDTVTVPLGCVVTEEGKPVSTVYTSAMDLDTQTYYYKTYDKGEIFSAALDKPDGEEVTWR